MQSKKLRRTSFLRFGLGTLAGTAALAAEGRAAMARDVDLPETLKYNNTFGQKVGPAWYGGKRVYAMDLGVTATKPDYQIAEQYIPIRASSFSNAKTVAEFKQQLKSMVGHEIYDSVPGMPQYSPIWHNNWVLVPHSYKANTLRSVEAVRKSGFPIHPADFWIN